MIFILPISTSTSTTLITTTITSSIIQEIYASQSIFPYSIRCYLRIKAGYMKESSCFRKYTTVWCVLVDQHLLIFQDNLDQNPKRIVYLYGDCWKTSRVSFKKQLLFFLVLSKDIVLLM